MLGKFIKISIAAVAVAGASAGVWWWRKTSSQPLTAADFNANIRNSTS